LTAAYNEFCAVIGHKYELVITLMIEWYK